jgi:hypothetical protein
MNFQLIGVLIRLRYRLLWAKTRTRNGKIALFFAGYVLLIMVISLLAAGGVGAGMTAIRSGKGLIIAGVLLGGIYGQAIVASVVLGFGMTAIFSETELRRYPVRALERRLTRHFIGIVDPYWLLFLALDLGLALGLYLFGAGSFWLGLIAALLLFCSNYVAARVLGILVDRLMMKKGGSAIMLVSMMLLGLLPAMLTPVIHRNPAIQDAVTRMWQSTPPAGAAVAMTQPNLAALSGLGMILLWTGALAAALVVLERRPPKIRVAQASKVVWESPLDRIGAIFGSETGPLVAFWLRFYSRHNRFRTIYPLALPLAAFLQFFYSRQSHDAGGTFHISLSVFLILGFIGTAQFAVNQFGYTAGGFRRFLLLPTVGSTAFRAGSYMFIMLSAALILPAALLWSLFVPAHFDPRAIIMLVAASVSSLFLFHGIALWTSLLGPRRGNYNQSFGNDLSFAGNLVVIGGMLCLLFGPQLAAKQWPGVLTPDYWYVTPVTAVLAVVFYFTSLHFATALFRVKRESLMVLLEGKS